ncbi:MAG TPA: hypothetical protein DCE41_02465 [Cytophagales bacterium]|nr:hypothetical protein [Cytophagales bacterium]
MEQTEQLRIQPEVTPVIPLLEQVVYDYTGVAQTQDITLEQALDTPGWILVDAQLMKVVLRNLLDNALKFTPAGGTVTVATRATEDAVELVVTDTGVGMSPAQWEQAQDEAQLTTSGKDTDGRTSTGLGLQLCLRLVHRQGGKMHLESEPGQGTQITLRFPQSKSPG